MANQNGIALSIKAFVPMGKTIDEQLATLNAVKAAHESGDYGPVLKLGKIEEVKAEQKTRRIEEQPPQQQNQGQQGGEQGQGGTGTAPVDRPNLAPDKGKQKPA